MQLSQKRIEANRLNTLQSTGPKTDEGKAKSAQNALQPGLTAQGDARRALGSLELDILLGGVNTVVLIGSSLTMALAVRSAQPRRWRKFCLCRPLRIGQRNRNEAMIAKVRRDIGETELKIVELRTTMLNEAVGNSSRMRSMLRLSFARWRSRC